MAPSQEESKKNNKSSSAFPIARGRNTAMQPINNQKDATLAKENK